MKILLQKARVEVFSDLPQPKGGRFAKLIDRELLQWNTIPRQGPPTVAKGATAVVGKSIGNRGPVRPSVRPRITGTQSRVIGRLGAGAIKSVAMGIAISLIEANVANDMFRDSAASLNELLQDLEENEEVDEAGWKDIEIRLREIANMRQSILGYVWEFVSYGQGSLAEKQALAMMVFTGELADKYGYRSTRTWLDMLRGEVTRYEKQQ
jgi:hypothetical protein